MKHRLSNITLSIIILTSFASKTTQATANCATSLCPQVMVTWQSGCAQRPPEEKAYCYEVAQVEYERCLDSCERENGDPTGIGIPARYIYVPGKGWTWVDIYGTPTPVHY